MKKFLIVALISITIQLSAQDTQGIQFFEDTWAATLEKVKTDNKVIFLDAYASWCSPCKRMAKNVFPQQKVGEYYNSNFIPVKIDMQKGEGKTIAQTYRVSAYPTFLFIDKNGEVVHRAVGEKSASEFIILGKIALDTSKNLMGIRNKYENNPMNPDKVLLYCNALKQGYDKSYQAVAEKYLGSISKTRLLEHKSWMIINSYIEKLSSPYIEYVV